VRTDPLILHSPRTPGQGLAVVRADDEGAAGKVECATPGILATAFTANRSEAATA
jgi:hypothetical protein